MKVQRTPVNKQTFCGTFIGVFLGALGARIIAGVNATATVAFLIIALAVAVIGVALVAFANDERLTVIESDAPNAVKRITELETHDFTITDGQNPDGTPIH